MRNFFCFFAGRHIGLGRSIMRALGFVCVLALAGVLGCGASTPPDPKLVAADKSIPNKDALKKIAEGVFHLEKFRLSETDSGTWANITAFGLDTASIPDVDHDPAALTARVKNVHIGSLATHCKEYIENSRDRGLSGITVSLKVSGYNGNQKTWQEIFKVSVDAKNFDTFIRTAAAHKMLDAPTDLMKVWEVEVDEFDGMEYEKRK
jgi:hypothetical protein